MSVAAIDAQYDSLRQDLASYLRDAGRLAVIKAPPGSGKTFTLIEVLSTLAGDVRVAIAAQTNSQVDDICLRFAKDHPDVPVTRFSSAGLKKPDGFPALTPWTG